MPRSTLEIQYLGTPVHVLELKIGPGQFIRNTFTTDHQKFDVTDIVTPAELNRSELFARLVAQGLYIAIFTAGTDDVPSLNGSVTEVRQNNVLVAAGTSILNFSGVGVSVVDNGGGEATVTVPGAVAIPATFDAAATAAEVVRNIVYISGPGAVTKANAASIGTMPVIGFISAKASAILATIQTDGPLSGFVGLTPGALYYASPSVAGAITTVAPIGAGEILQRVGIAITTTTLEINLDDDYIVI